MPRPADAVRHDLSASGCEIRDDLLHRRLYATDASIYEIEPSAIAFPKTAGECAAVVRAAAQHDLPITARGAGTGLVGGALGDGLVVDMARYGRWIEGLDLESATVRVGPGVVLDQLNRFLAPHGLCFGPDVATASRATIGGMVNNNSSGAHSPVYGTTAEHVGALEIVLADGTIATIGADHPELPRRTAAAAAIVDACRDEIDRRMPPGVVKRWTGYGLDRFATAPHDLTALIAGSEGTLALVAGAELKLVPVPRSKSLGVLFFVSVPEAMAAAAEVAELKPSAIEHLDARVFEQTRGQISFGRARALLELDDKPCAAMLFVEFFDDDGERLAALERLNPGTRCLRCADPGQQELVWSMRRAGLSLLTGCAGPAKPTACIEDVCVRRGDLPRYVDDLMRTMDSLGLEASYYGHAAAGELHVRPVLDLHTEIGVERLRDITDAVAELALRYEASFAAEHGVGIARTSYLAEHLGDQLIDATRHIKDLFDPHGRLNPGKIVDTARFSIDRDLRFGAGYRIDPGFREVLSFAPRDLSFVNNLEQCNGCGGCRKDPPTMCPTFAATGEEQQSTRGRANIMRSALDGHFDDDGLLSGELATVLDDCLACKACAAECPSGVDLAKLKAEVLNARHRLRPPSLFDRLVANADLLGRIGCTAPNLVNRILRWPPARAAMERVLGISRDRILPAYTGRRFDRWFARREKGLHGGRGTVLLWDDTWVRYHEPQIASAAVEVLENAGFDIVLAEDRRCCGRPAFSRGLIDDAKANAVHNITMLGHQHANVPILFLEPSCHSMFVDEYRQFGIVGADAVAERCILFEDFLASVLDASPGALELASPLPTIHIHQHCHSKALTDVAHAHRLAERLGTSAHELATGCCGMAGAFGMQASKQELSRAIAEPLIRAVGELDGDDAVVATGTSCRHQIHDLGGAEALHIAELIARHLNDHD